MRNRYVYVFLFFIAVFAAAFFVGGAASISGVHDVSSSSSIESAVDVYYFFGEGCSHCANVEPLLAEMEQVYPIRLHRYDLYNDRSYLGVFDEYANRHDLSFEQRVVPIIFVSDVYFVGDTSILDGFEAAVTEVLRKGSLGGGVFGGRSEVRDQEAIQTVLRLSMMTVTVSAFVDSLSPCSIAILVFLIGARVVAANRRQRALKVGLVFCVSIFIAYFLSGLGLFTVVQISGFSSVFSLVVGVAAALIGVFYLKDVFWYGRGGFVMEVPRSLKPVLTKMLKGVTSPLGAFTMGFAVCLFELPCTGGPYLFILGQLANESTYLQAIPWLVYYNLIFVLPLVTISLLLYSGRTSIERVRRWNVRHKRGLRLVSGLVIMALGVYTLPVASVLQLVLPALSSLRTVSGYLLAATILGFTAFVTLKRKPASSTVAFLLLILIIPTVIGLNSVNSLTPPSSTSLSPRSVSQLTTQCGIQNSLKGGNVMASTLSPLVLAGSDVKFIGFTLDIEYRFGGGDIRVLVTSVLDGPPGIMWQVYEIGWVSGLPPDLQPGYYIELGIGVGDSVEVYADYDGDDVTLTKDSHYIKKGSAGCSVDIEFDGGESCFESGDSIKIRLEFRSDGVLTDPSDFEVISHSPYGDSDISNIFGRKSTGVYEGTGTAGSSGTRTVEVSATIDGCNVETEGDFEVKDTCEGVDGELVCGYLTTVQSFSFIQIEGCDGTDYVVVWESHPDLYGELSNHLGKYVRLTGVTFEGTTPPGSHTIVGWESLQVIVSCSDCVAGCAIAIGFDSGETCFEPGDPVTMRLYFMYDGLLTDPSHFQAILQKPGLDSDITNQFARVAEGVYESTGTVGDPGARTLSVTATIEGCPADKEEGYEVRDKCTETNCLDSVDDDGDGLIDCEDPDCGDAPSCSCAIEVYLDSGETCFNPDTVDITLRFMDGYGVLTEPSTKTIILDQIGVSLNDITSGFMQVSEGVYTMPLTVSSLGAYRLNVNGTIGGCFKEKIVGFIVKDDCSLLSRCFDVAYAIKWDGYGDMETGCTSYEKYYDIHQVGVGCDIDYYYFLWEIDGEVGQPVDSNFNFWAWIDVDDNPGTGGTLGSEYAVYFSMFYGSVDSAWTGLFDASSTSWPLPKLRDITVIDYCINGSYLEVRVPIQSISGGQAMKVWMGVDVNFYVLPICMDEVDSLYIPEVCSCPDGDGDRYRDGACGGRDCDDDNPGINPGTPEVCDNVDNDCDGVVDGNTKKCFVDLDPWLDGVGVCAAGTQTCTAGQWGTGCTGEVTPGSEDACWNGLDDDCDEAVDENCLKTPTCFPDTVGRVKSSTQVKPSNPAFPAMGGPQPLMFVATAMIVLFQWRKEQRSDDVG